MVVTTILMVLGWIGHTVATRQHSSPDLAASAANRCASERFLASHYMGRSWPARCVDSSAREEACLESCPSWLGLRCAVGHAPQGELCCGPSGPIGNLSASCAKCGEAEFSDGSNGCAPCTRCEEQGEFHVADCTAGTDTVCHAMFKTMHNKQGRGCWPLSANCNEGHSADDALPEEWHLPSHAVVWTDGRSLFSFGGVASSLVPDRSTNDSCAVEPGSAVDEYPAGTAAGEPLLTNELWQLQIDGSGGGPHQWDRPEPRPVIPDHGSHGKWKLIGGGPSRTVDRYVNGDLALGYFGENYGTVGDENSTELARIRLGLSGSVEGKVVHDFGTGVSDGARPALAARRYLRGI